MKPKQTKSTVNKPKAPPLFRVDAWWQKPMGIFNQLWEKVNNLARTNFELGCEQVAQGLVNDAIFRFRVAVWLEPRHYLAWYNLGCCYLSKGDIEKSTQAFRKTLAIRPNYEEARFMLVTLDNKLLPRDQHPQAMPMTLVVSQFEDAAPTYDRMQLDSLGYRGHVLLQDAIFRVLDKSRVDYSMLELGIGTGICGMLLRSNAAVLIGVDVSPAMVALASQHRDPTGRKIYDDIHQADARAFLPNVADVSYDVVAAANLAPYLGDLGQLFDQCARILRPGGVLAITAETSDYPQGYHVVPGLARFGHSQDYLRQQAARVGLVEASIEEVNAYANYKMLQCVWRRP